MMNVAERKQATAPAEAQTWLARVADTEKFVAECTLLKDGGTAPAELLVPAIGYKNQQDAVRLSASLICY